MKEAVVKSPSIRNYFVDEAGDGTLFDRKGRVKGPAGDIGTSDRSQMFTRLGAEFRPLAFTLYHGPVIFVKRAIGRQGGWAE